MPREHSRRHGRGSSGNWRVQGLGWLMVGSRFLRSGVAAALLFSDCWLALQALNVVLELHLQFDMLRSFEFEVA
jgi:hypothetical protein